MRSPRALRRSLLRKGRSRKSDRRAVRALRRPCVLGDHGGEPVAHVVVGHGLYPRRRATSRRSVPYPIRRSLGPDHSPQIAQARCSGKKPARAAFASRWPSDCPDKDAFQTRLCRSAPRLRLRLNQTAAEARMPVLRTRTCASDDSHRAKKSTRDKPRVNRTRGAGRQAKDPSENRRAVPKNRHRATRDPTKTALL